MEQQTNDKMILAILQGDDYDSVVRELNKNGFYVTLLNTMGGFLRKRSVTIMIGLESARLDAAALRAALPEVAERFTRTTTCRRFCVA